MPQSSDRTSDGESVRASASYAVWLVAAAYFATAKLSLLLAAPPGFAVTIWPAAGVALAAVLAWGPRVCPGIFLAGAAANLVDIEFHPAGEFSLLGGVTVAATIGVGAALQAFFAASLVRRFVADVSSLAGERDVARFVLAAGPIGCLVSATVGVSALHLAGAIPATDLPFNWATWWFGDSIGSILFAPLLLAWMRPSPAMPMARRVALMVPVAAAMAVVILFLYARRDDEARISAVFERQTRDLGDVFRRNVAHDLEVLRTTARYMANDEGVDRSHFRSFVSGFLPRHPEIRAISWIERVPPPQRSGFEAARRREGLTGFAIHEAASGRRAFRAAALADSFPITYVEPEAENAAILGVDVASDEVRREALRRALDGRIAAATAPTPLLGDEGGPPTSVVVYHRVDRGAGSQSLAGVVALVFRVDGLLTDALRGVEHLGIEISLADVGDGDVRRLGSHPAASSGNDVSSGRRRDLERRVAFEVAGRPWVLRFTAGEEYQDAHRSLEPWGLLTTRLGVMALFAALLLVLTGRTAIVEALVRERTAALETEMSERTASAEALRTSEERFRSLSVASPVGIFQADAQGRWLYVNPRWQGMAGITSDAALGEGWLQAVHPDDRESVAQEWRAAVARGCEYEQEFRLQARGEMRWAFVRAAAVRSISGAVVGFVGTSEDVTGRKHGEQRTRESEERYRMLAEQSTDLISRHHLDGRTIYASPACQTILGYGPEELLGRSIYDLFHPADLEPYRRRIAAAEPRGEVVTVSYRIRRKNSDYAWVESSLRVLPDPSTGEPSEIVSVSRDISDRRHLERMRQDMIAMLSHDIKNPLAAVLGFAEILRDLPIDDARRREFLARIEANAHTALSLAINFVDFTQIESGTIEPRFETVSLNEIVDDALSHQEARARVKEMRLETDLDESIPSAALDRRLIDRVIANLVNNAVKFSPPRSRVLVETLVRDGRAIVRVRDEGPGIAVEHRAKLFQRFSHAGSRRVDSSGLGLFIVKTLVDAQGGTIAAHFPPQGGSVFELSFPATKALPVRTAAAGVEDPAD